jgi:hypothetical protein
MKAQLSSSVTFFLPENAPARTWYSTTLDIRGRRFCRFRGRTSALLPTSIFSPLTLPSPKLRQCEGRKNAAPQTTNDILSKTLGSNTFPGGFLKCWDHPNQLLSVPAVIEPVTLYCIRPQAIRGSLERSPPI